MDIIWDCIYVDEMDINKKYIHYDWDIVYTIIKVFIDSFDGERTRFRKSFHNETEARSLYNNLLIEHLNDNNVIIYFYTLNRALKC